MSKIKNRLIKLEGLAKFKPTMPKPIIYVGELETGNLWGFFDEHGYHEFLEKDEHAEAHKTQQSTG